LKQSNEQRAMSEKERAASRGKISRKGAKAQRIEKAMSDER